MGPVLNKTFIVGFSQKVITKKITFFEKYNSPGGKKKVVYSVSLSFENFSVLVS